MHGSHVKYRYCSVTLSKTSLQSFATLRLRSTARCTADSLCKAMAAQPVSAASAIDFFMLLQNLKNTPRTGWVRRGVEGPESIADHMYRMSLMSLVTGPSSGVDYTRCIKLSIVHDVAEAIVGDIAPGDGVSDAEKHRLEQDAIQQIRTMLGSNSAAGEEVEALWNEYESAATPEAALVKDFDKLEMIIQAHEYERAQGLDLQEFFASTEGKFRTKVGREWAAELLSRRTQSQALQ